MSCNICCQSTCNGCNGIPQAQGDSGQPAFLNINGIISGSPSVNSTNLWRNMGQFIFSKDVANIFTSIRVNVWVNVGIGNFRIVAKVPSLPDVVIYLSPTISSTSVVNIETKKALQIYNASSAIITLETQGSGSNSVFFGSAMFGYEV